MRLFGLMEGIGNPPATATGKQLDHYFGDDLMTRETTNITPMKIRNGQADRAFK